MSTKIGNLVRRIYARVLRPLILRLVDDPDELWDDHLIALLDELFDYKP